jgi:hypothetical protein
MAAALLLTYLFFSRGFWFSDLERQTRVAKDRLSRPLDITQAGKVSWCIRAEEWKYTGECEVALVLDRVNTIHDAAYRKESRALNLKVDAYAIPFEPAGPNKRIDGPATPRLIRNWYYTTDEPFAQDARIWELWGNVVELGLGGLHRYPFEDTWVVVDVLKPDLVLAMAKPRLEIVPQHDYAVHEHIGILRAVRDSVLVLLGLCVIGLAYASLKRPPT